MCHLRSTSIKIIIFCEKKINQTKDKLHEYDGFPASLISKNINVVYWISLWSNKLNEYQAFLKPKQLREYHDILLTYRIFKV